MLGPFQTLLTYYKDGYLLNEHITVTHIDLHTKVVKCTDAFRSMCKFNLNDIIDAK
ncbi:MULTISPECIES: YolD-like family protein [Bacillus cereus group]|uniref:YolD-like family protein n=1 Tax=Bacillus cereus group TaxID=86661 RepID=UPI000A049F8A|nr:YolD-like family protein [Bacillus mobilis]